jgi:hypothetical protein
LPGSLPHRAASVEIGDAHAGITAC